MSRANYLQFGGYNAICDRCGEKRKSTDLKETWDSLYVCEDTCWEPRQPLDFLRGIPDDPSTPWNRPEGADTGGTDINGDTFPPTFADVGSTVPDGTFDGDL